MYTILSLTSIKVTIVYTKTKRKKNPTIRSANFEVGICNGFERVSSSNGFVFSEPVRKQCTYYFPSLHYFLQTL